jgi:hypothetical protein
MKKLYSKIQKHKRLMAFAFVAGVMALTVASASAQATGGFSLMDYDPATGLTFTPATLVQAVIGYIKDIVFYAAVIWAAWAGIKWVKRLIFGR